MRVLLLIALLLAPASASAQAAAIEGGTGEAPPTGDAAAGDAASEVAPADLAATDPAADRATDGAATPSETAASEAAPAEEARPDVVILSVGGDARRADASRARRAVAEALRQDGMTPVPDGDVALRIPPSRLAACADTACAFAFAPELGVSMVAAVTTWAGDDGPSSLTVSLIVGPRRSYSADDDVGAEGIEAAARAAVTAAQDARRRALIIEGVGAGSEADEEDEAEGGSPDEPSVFTRERSLEEWVLPSILGVVGLGLVGTSVYALLDEQCQRRGASGVCLRGDAPNLGLGILMAVAGGVSIAGALIWIILGGQPANTGHIDVVVGPEGGYAGWVGVF